MHTTEFKRGLKLRTAAMPRLALLSALLAAVTACSYVPQIISPFRMEIQQGNMVTQDMVAKLVPGLSKEQVRFILGTPLVVDPFRTDRWDYVFVRQPENSSEIEKRRIVVFFENDRLKRVEGDVVAAAAGGGSGESGAAPAAASPPAGAK